MLEGLDDFEWQALGSEHVREWLRDLASPDDAVQSEALDNLFG